MFSRTSRILARRIRPLCTAATPASRATEHTRSPVWAGIAAGAAGFAAVAAATVAAGTTSPAHASVTVLAPPPERSAFKPPFQEQFPGVFESLVKVLGEDNVTLDEDELEQRGKEQSGYATPSNPQCVVFPNSTEDVSNIMKIAYKHEIPIVPYAAGTSLEGHTVAVRGGITIDTKNMDNVLKINEEDMDVVVQPGVSWVDLNDTCRPYKMFLGVDPAPGACIGGMCGTCCSGTNAVRYGTMKEQVLNLTVVLADGTILKTGQRARKSSAGYDLARLFVGSEGTLGIVTEATLRMRHIPEFQRVARVTFPTVHAACESVIEILQRGVQVGAVELLDEEMVRAINKDSGLSLPEKPTILFKFTGTEAHVKDDISVVAGIISKHTSEGYQFCETKTESDRLWDARKVAFWAAQNYLENKEIMATDVAVPISKLADAIMATKKELDSSFLFCPIVGHVGDGNFHTVICFDPLNAVENEEAHRLNVQMVKRAISMEGTCTGEHGIGIGKKEYLVPELGEPAVELMRKLKKALDPKNLLNPGKIIDVDQ